MAAVEFALLLPIFIILLVGILEFAQVLFMQVALQHAVTFAARCASQFGAAGALGSHTPAQCDTPANIATVASQQAYGVSVSSSVFTVTQASAGSEYNCVYASYTETFTIPFMPNFSIPLTANSCYPATSTL